jgi:hypothetical protein
MMFVPDKIHTYWPPRCVRGIALLLYVDIRASQETRLLASTACYGDGLVLQLGGWAWGYQPLTVKSKYVTKMINEPQTWTEL